MITLRSLAMCGVAALAALSLTGCGSTRELQHKDVEIAELKRQIAELESELAKANTREVKNTAPGQGTDALTGEGIGVSETSEGTVVTLASDVFFRSGSNEINAAAKSALNRVVAVIEKEPKYAGKKIRVDGHTDSDPIKRSKWRDNQELSEARADSVKTYLVGRGIPDSRIKTVGHADTKPLGKDKAKNRRVEILILK
jgi:flagellar motor protein MotB